MTGRASVAPKRCCSAEIGSLLNIPERPLPSHLLIMPELGTNKHTASAQSDARQIRPRSVEQGKASSEPNPRQIGQKREERTASSPSHTRQPNTEVRAWTHRPPGPMLVKVLFSGVSRQKDTTAF